MAVTKIKAIKSTLDKAIKYICNPAKTQGKLLVDSFGCVPEFAAQQMEAVAKKNVRGGCRKAYHLIQSFAPDDNITPEKALEIGKKFADGVTNGKHQYVISVHTDRDHIHCHIIFNAVNTEEYLKYHYKGYSERDRIRDISDQLCKDNGLSVLPRWTKGKGHRPQYEKSWSQKLREAIDRTILISDTFEDFVTAMEMEEGYTFKGGKHIAFMAEAEGQKKYTRCDTIGKNHDTNYYTEEMIRDRIANKEKYKDTDFSMYPKKSKQKKDVSRVATAEKKKTGVLKEEAESGRKNDTEKEGLQEIFGSYENTGQDNEKQQETSSSHENTDSRKEEQQKTSNSHEGSSKKGSFRGDRKIRLISDLSKNIKAQNSPGYKHVAEKNNLNMFVKTMNFMEQHDIETPEKFLKFYESCYGEVTRLNKEIQQTDMEISGLSERRYHIRRYFKYLKFYNTFIKYRNMNYYQEHEKELQEFELSKLWLERSGIDPRKYKAQEYQDEYCRLKSRKEALKEKLQPAKDLLYDTKNAMKNVESVLGIKFYESEENDKASEQTVREKTQQNNKNNKKER